MRIRIAAVALSALAGLLTAEPARATECAIPAGTPAATPESEAEFERATECVLGEQRAALGLVQLRGAPRLAGAAELHARDMVTREFFSHVSPEGNGLLERVRASRYLRPRWGYALGEVLGWGSGSLGSPTAMMQAWLDSPGHRHVIANPVYRDVGVAVVAGLPSGSPSGATYAVIFGRRERP